MRLRFKNCLAIFAVDTNIFAVSMAQKLFAIQRQSHTTVIKDIEAPMHAFDKWFTQLGEELHPNDWDDLLIVKYKWYDRSNIPVAESTDRYSYEDESRWQKRRAERNAEEVTIRYRDLPEYWKQWRIPIADDSPPTRFPYSFITSVADTISGCTVFACDILGNVWELDKE